MNNFPFFMCFYCWPLNFSAFSVFPSLLSYYSFFRTLFLFPGMPYAYNSIWISSARLEVFISVELFSGVNFHARFYGNVRYRGDLRYWLPFGSLNLFSCVFAAHNIKCGLLLFFGALSSSAGSTLWLLPEMKHISCVLRVCLAYE